MNNPVQVMQMVQQLKSNPMAMLSRRFKLPQNLQDPNDILNYLVQSGQVSQQQINSAYQAAQRFR